MMKTENFVRTNGHARVIMKLVQSHQLTNQSPTCYVSLRPLATIIHLPSYACLHALSGL